MHKGRVVDATDRIPQTHPLDFAVRSCGGVAFVAPFNRNVLAGSSPAR